MLQVPLAMDAIGSFVVAASAPLDIKVWRVDTQPASKLGGEAVTLLTVVRELSIMSVGQPLRVRLLVSLTFETRGAYAGGQIVEGDQGCHSPCSAIL